MSSARKTSSKTEREEHLQKVALLDRRGWGQYDIARELGVSQALISKDLKIIRKRYVEAMHQSRDELIAEMIVKYQDVRRSAWAAYDRSETDSRKEVEEFAVAKGDDGSYAESEVRIRRIVTVEGRLPNNQYLQTINATLEAERKLLGLDKVEASGGASVVVNIFDAIASAVSAPSSAGTDAIESKIAALGTPAVAPPEAPKEASSEPGSPS